MLTYTTKPEPPKVKAVAEAKAGAWVSDPNDPINEKFEVMIIDIINGHRTFSRRERIKSTGEITKADLEKVDVLNLGDGKLTELPKGLEKFTELETLFLENNQLTDVKGLEKLTQLKILWLDDNPDLTKAQIDELQKALPKCDISSNPTK